MTRARIHVRYRENRALWEVDYRDDGGVRRRPLFASEEDALARAAEIRRALGGQRLEVPDRDITLKAYADRWLEAIVGEIELSTWRNYQERLRSHILPTLGRLRLRDLRRRHIKQLLNAKRAAGYAANGVRLIKATLSSLLTDAVDDEIIDTNPGLQVGRKKRRAGTVTAADRTQKIKPMSWEQRTRFLEAAQQERRFFVVFQVLAKAGLRPGEAFALQLGDVDFQAQTLQVERAVNLGRIKPTKTYDCRTVDLTPDLLRELHRHVLRLKEEALRRGWGEPVWLFPNDANNPYDKWKAGDAFRRTLKRAGIPHFRLYDLRHTYASLLLAAGAPITYVSAQLGHANPSTTLRHYAKWIPSQGRRWVEVLDRADWSVGLEIGTKIWNQAGSNLKIVAQAIEKFGEPCGTRTHDPLIKSQVLYRLS
jgi:integrase